MAGIQDIRKKLEGIDLELTKRLIIEFIKDYFRKSKAKRAILGLSGGVDSATTLALVVSALGSERVHVLILPVKGVTPEADLSDARSLVRKFGVSYSELELNSILDSYGDLMKDILSDKVTRGNLTARIRMSILYAYANYMGGLVVGTSDKSELLIGYYTKYGDGGADLLPIGDLYKTQVRMLAEHLGIPKHIARKPSSPALWQGQTAESELGISYEVIDVILYGFVELGMSKSELYGLEGISKNSIDAILRRVSLSEHKRVFPRIPKIQRGPTVGLDWRFPVWFGL